MASKAQVALKVLEDTGVLIQFPSPSLTTATLVLTATQLEGPITYAGSAAATWSLPKISASEAAAGGTLLGRQVHIHNGSLVTMRVDTAGEFIGRATGIEDLTISANGSVGLIAQFDSVSGQYFWQPMYLNSATLIAPTAPTVGSVLMAGAAPTVTVS